MIASREELNVKLVSVIEFRNKYIFRILENKL